MTVWPNYSSTPQKGCIVLNLFGGLMAWTSDGESGMSASCNEDVG